MPADRPPSLRSGSPTADVIPFPTRLRTGKIARVAETLIESTEKAAAYHWRRTIGDMQRQMERAGLDPAVIDFELRVFAEAVRNEMTRRSYGQTTHTPGGGDAA